MRTWFRRWIVCLKHCWSRVAEKIGERPLTELDATYPKALAKLDREWRHPSAFYDLPGEHWRHLRTANASSRASRR